MSTHKEVLVVGFGAVGVIYSFLLKNGENVNVTCVARGNYDATQANGIHIRSRKYGKDVRGWKPDRIFRTVAEAADRPYSYVIIATKALPDIAPLSSLLGPLFSREDSHPLPIFLILQNGLGVERDLYAAIKELGGEEPKIISTALWIGTNLLKDNVVEHIIDEQLHIGMYRPTYQHDITNTPQEAAILQGFADLLAPSGSTVHVLHEVQRVKFRRNIWNATLVSCSVLTRHSPQAFFRNPEVEMHVAPQLVAIMHEIMAIGRAMGFDEQALPSETVDTTSKASEKAYKDPENNHRPSMLVDLELGRPMETEAIVGELIRNAKEYRVDAPRLELIYSLLTLLQHQVKVAKV